MNNDRHGPTFVMNQAILFYKSDFQKVINEIQKSGSNSLQDQHNVAIAKYLINPHESPIQFLIKAIESTKDNKLTTNYVLAYHLALCFFINGEYNLSFSVLNPLLEKTLEDSYCILFCYILNAEIGFTLHNSNLVQKSIDWFNQKGLLSNAQNQINSLLRDHGFEQTFVRHIAEMITFLPLRLQVFNAFLKPPAQVSANNNAPNQDSDSNSISISFHSSSPAPNPSPSNSFISDPSQLKLILTQNTDIHSLYQALPLSAAAFGSGNFDRFLKIIGNTEDPDNPSLLCNRALFELFQNRSSSSLLLFQRALTKSLSTSFQYPNKHIENSKQTNPPSEISNSKTRNAKPQKDKKGNINSGNVSQKENDKAEKSDIVNPEFLISHPQQQILFGMGLAYLQQQHPRKAFPYLTACIPLMSQSPFLWLRLAECCCLYYKQRVSKLRARFQLSPIIMRKIATPSRKFIVLPLSDAKLFARYASPRVPNLNLEFGNRCASNAITICNEILAKFAQTRPANTKRAPLRKLAIISQKDMEKMSKNSENSENKTAATSDNSKSTIDFSSPFIENQTEIEEVKRSAQLLSSFFALEMGDGNKAIESAKNVAEQLVNSAKQNLAKIYLSHGYCLAGKANESSKTLKKLSIECQNIFRKEKDIQPVFFLSFSQSLMLEGEVKMAVKNMSKALETHRPESTLTKIFWDLKAGKIKQAIDTINSYDQTDT